MSQTSDPPQSKSTGQTQTGPTGYCLEGSKVRAHLSSHWELLGPPQ